MGKTRSRRPTTGITLDAGALIALDRGNRRMIALLEQAGRAGRKFRIPAGVVAQVWRDGRIQVALSRFLRSEAVQVVPLDDYISRTCGELCGVTGTSDVIDASVVVLAWTHGDVIITSDPVDLRRLDPKAAIVEIREESLLRSGFARRG